MLTGSGVNVLVDNKIQLIGTAGPMTGKAFASDEHGALLFGRLEGGHCCLPDGGQVSRFLAQMLYNLMNVLHGRQDTR